MHCFYLDASALAKRFVPEQGSSLIDEILDKVPGERLYILNVGAGEVVSILVRKRNLISDPIDFENEIVRSADINKLPISNRLATSSFALIVIHSINSTDAVTLKSALAIDKKLRVAGNRFALVASDQRRAAQAEDHVQSRNRRSNSIGGSHGAIGGRVSGTVLVATP
jgi:predicted nucleic acid-binding protein